MKAWQKPGVPVVRVVDLWQAHVPGAHCAVRGHGLQQAERNHGQRTSNSSAIENMESVLLVLSKMQWGSVCRSRPGFVFDANVHGSDQLKKMAKLKNSNELAGRITREHSGRERSHACITCARIVHCLVRMVPKH